MPRLASLAAALAVPLALSSSCGLISSDVTDFNLRLPEKPFSVDTATWELNTSVSEVPSIPCPPADCAAVQSEFCMMDACEVSCDGGAHCAARVQITASNPFDLKTEAPELQKIDAQAVVSVTVEEIAFRIDENTLNMATPPLKIHLAPTGIVDPSDPLADEIGTIAAVQVGQTGPGMIELTADGKAKMAEYMSNWRTPFNVLVTGDVTISAGQPMPSGRLSGVVTVTAHAGL